MMPRPHELEPVIASLWSALFSTPIHLDSALAKLPRAVRGPIADVLPELLRRPRSLSRALGVALAADEPWSLAPAELAKWRAAVRIAIAAMGSKPAREAAGEDDFPPRMIAELRASFGDETARALVRSLASRPPIALRAPRKLGVEPVLEAIAGAERSAIAPLGARVLDHARFVAARDRLQRFEPQDEGSQLLSLFALWPERVAHLLRARPGAIDAGAEIMQLPQERRVLTVIDACAGAGGKALAIADALGGRGRVFAYDISARKLGALRERAARAELTNVKTALVEDGREAELVARFRGTADVVLVDAPCSGWGVLRRNPDIKWRQGEDALSRLPELQARLLRAYAPLVKPGGRLVYAVCTLRVAETTAIVEAFARERPEMELKAGGYLGPDPCDGFFMQSFVRARDDQVKAMSQAGQ